MPRDTTVIAFRQPEAIDDPLTEVACEDARRMLAQVLIAEAASFIAMWKDLRLPDDRGRIVRHGHGPHRANHSRTGCRADCLTAGALTLGESVTAPLDQRRGPPRLIFIKPEQHCERRPSMRL
jgi:hypothetical protein